MRTYCTYFDTNYLSRGLGLHQSLLSHAGDFELVVLCMDEEVETILKEKALPRVRLITVKDLTGSYPALAAAQTDRTQLEFYFTCTSWLMRHLLDQLPAGELLTYLDADLFFFHSPDPIYEAIGTASIAITPHRFPVSLGHLARYGRYNVGWVSFRRDEQGLACAADWAEKCAAWCFNLLEADRYADQKYLDAWHERFPGTVGLTNAGINAAPWNIRDATISAGPAGPQIEGQPLIFYHFHALVPLGSQLFDPSLHRYDATLSEGLRTLVYQPYLHALHHFEEVEAATPELVPPALHNDPRCGLALPHLLERLRASELDRAVRLSAIEENRAATQQAIDYLRLVEKDRDQARADQDNTVALLREVERDSAERLQSIHFYQEKLKTAYADLERNVKYLKTLEAEIQAHIKVSNDKDAIIADLSARLQANNKKPETQSSA
ncbi:MAG: hypothetical protein K9N01_02895 [Cephaloticoccus sp.]|nr:hypothetical protein [Cephaloticoccus sp.]